jgi:acetyl-CoA acetyltransferase family protein
MRPVYIIDGSRTPFLKARTGPGPFTPVDLAVQCGRPLLLRQPFKPQDFDRVILGCVNVIADEMNPARVAALRLGMGEAMPAFTMQINCGSGMQSIDTAYRYIQNGTDNLLLAGGAEALSYAPLVFNKGAVNWFGRMFTAKTVWQRLANFFTLRPSFFFAPVIGLERGLTDPIVELNMGQTAEVVAKLFNITRRQADEYAAESQQRLAKAQKEGYLNDEVIPAFAKDGKVYTYDDGVRPDSTVETLAKLRPVFERPWGKVTAGNSSQITDGASWVILASEDAVKKHGLKPKAKIIDSVDHGTWPCSLFNCAFEAAEHEHEGRRSLGAERGFRGAGARLPRGLRGREVRQGSARSPRRGRQDRPRAAECRRRRDCARASGRHQRQPHRASPHECDETARPEARHRHRMHRRRAGRRDADRDGVKS